jgi:CO/xanthine dehydrogenase FAD-binding subunit
VAYNRGITEALMITAYHRPHTLDEAVALLAQPDTRPLGGGTILSQPGPDPVQVVDLQSLGLSNINKKGGELEIGATTTLQALLESTECPQALQTAIKFEAPLNLRNSATVAGTLVTSDGRSTFTTALLALDARVEYRLLTQNGGRSSAVSGLSEYVLTRPHALITSVSIPLHVKFAFESVSRTPADKPIVCAALAQWNSGRTRLALGGYGKTPLLAMDGTEAEGFDTAARNAYHEAGDEWASAEYRMDIAATLAKRCLEAIR